MSKLPIGVLDKEPPIENYEPVYDGNDENEKWTVKIQDGSVYGPVDTETLRRWIQEKRVLANDYVWIKEKREWNLARSIHSFSDLFGNISSKISTPSNSSKYFFPTSKTKLVVMSLCTLGIYELYWFCKNWQFVKEKEKIDISPFWRAWFSIFYCYRLFKTVQEYANQNSVESRFRPGLLAFGYILCIISVKLPDPYWLIAELGLLFLLPIQGTINELQTKLAQKSDINRRFSGWNIFGIVVGIIWWVLIFLGMTE